MEPIEWINTVNEIGESQIVDRSFEWVFWSLIVTNLIFFAIVRTVSPSYFKALFVTGLYNRYLLQYSQEDLKLSSLSSYLLSLSYLNCLSIIGSMFLNLGFNHFTFILLALLAIALLLKFGFMQFVIFLTKTKDGIHEHLLNHMVYLQISGVILTPLLIFTYYLPDSYSAMTIIGLLSVISFFIFIREVQSLIKTIRARIGVLYIILYLCTLELLPLVLIFKAFVND